ncbi:uncharacterized protein LOC133925291 isoform X2 [Phragmites australis]|nr:uncharacterized protein LOC133925291 isoform X2 [Phragmites australis]XP_062227188.1 uncharacterized protein LOC133925291 isoform X2 [Phragmites australis]XP_062227190.1 uncharacterized protein LOC133925291 isoform X2 [Phragmites australis]
MVPKNITRKRTYADFSHRPVVPRFKLFDDIDILDLETSWSIVVMIDVKFPIQPRYRDSQHFILMDTCGSKMEAIASNNNVERFNALLAEGCVYTLHEVRFDPNWEEALQFRNIGHRYECVLNNRTRVEPYTMPIQFPLYPKHLMSFPEVYRRPNKTFVDIAGVVVHWAAIEHIGCSLYREVTLMDTRCNLIVVGVWSHHLTRHARSWTLANANNDIVLLTMLQNNRRHGCLETSEHTTFKFNPSHCATRALQSVRRSVITGSMDLRFVNRFLENRWAYLATVV